LLPIPERRIEDQDAIVHPLIIESGGDYRMGIHAPGV
jgi:hypothetical protein